MGKDSEGSGEFIFCCFCAIPAASHIALPPTLKCAAGASNSLEASLEKNLPELLVGYDSELSLLGLPVETFCNMLHFGPSAIHRAPFPHLSVILFCMYLHVNSGLNFIGEM